MGTRLTGDREVLHGLRRLPAPQLLVGIGLLWSRSGRPGLTGEAAELRTLPAERRQLPREARRDRRRPSGSRCPGGRAAAPRGSSASASSAGASGWRRSRSAHSSSTGHRQARIELEQLVSAPPRGQHARAARPRAGERRVAARRRRRRGATRSRGRGVPARGQAQAALGGERSALRRGRAGGRGPVRAAAARRRARRRAAGRARRGACMRLGMSTSRRGEGCSRATASQQDLRPGVVAADQRPRPEHLRGEPGHHLGEPVERVGVVRAILGVAVQRQVRQHDAEAVGEMLDGRLELLVGEHRRVQQRERRPGAELPVGHARAVRWW